MGSLPSLPDTSQASDDGIDVVMPLRNPSCAGTRPTSPNGFNHHVAPAESDYTYKVWPGSKSVCAVRALQPCPYGGQGWLFSALCCQVCKPWCRAGLTCRT